MKNTKLIALVALLVVISMVVSIVIATSNDNKTAAQIQQTVDSYQSKIDALNKTIADLNAGLISANKALEQLQGAGLDVEAWTEATAQLPAKLEELQKVYVDFVASFESKKDAGDAQKNFEALYVYTIGDVNVVKELANITNKAISDLERATSVKAMNDIIAAYGKALKAYPTKIQTLDATLATLNTVSLEKFETYVFAKDLFDEVVASKILPVDEDGKETAKDTYQETFDDLFEEFKPLAIDAYVAAVESIPAVETLSLNHVEAVKKANDAYTTLTARNFYTATELVALNNKDFHNAEKTLAEINVHMGILNTIYGKELGENDPDPTTFTTAVNINWLIASYKKTAIKADLATDAWLDNLNSIVKTWDEKNHKVGDYEYVVVDEDGKYVADVYNMIDRATLASYNTAFAKATADLATSAQAFIDAVAAFDGKVTPNSKAALDAAYDLYKVASGKMTAANLDKILGYDQKNEDGEYPMGVVKSFAKYLELGTAYADITSSIKGLEEWVTDTIIIKCQKPDVHGKVDPTTEKVVVCDCKNVGEIDYTLVTDLTIKGFDDMIVKLLGVYGLDETVFNADALTTYKALRYYNQIDAITKAIKAANDGSDKGNFAEALLLENLEKVATDYTFAVKFVCADPDNKNHKEHTSACVYVMNIENAPETFLETEFSTAKINEAFGK